MWGRGPKEVLCPWVYMYNSRASERISASQFVTPPYSLVTARWTTERLKMGERKTLTGNGGGETLINAPALTLRHSQELPHQLPLLTSRFCGLLHNSRTAGETHTSSVQEGLPSPRAETRILPGRFSQKPLDDRIPAGR